MNFLQLQESRFGNFIPEPVEGSRKKTVIRLFLADVQGWARSALGERRII